MNIVIIGMRGAGKSNVSRRLSVLVKRPVFATDDMIVYENGGKSIDDIIADNNGDWFQFRDLEFDTVKKIGQMAREDIEKLLETRVMLTNWVKVKSGWSNDERAMKSLGYDDI